MPDTLGTRHSATSWVPLEGNRGHIRIGNMALKNAPDIDGNIPLPVTLEGVQFELPQLRMITLIPVTGPCMLMCLLVSTLC